jgi:hypothetical protein
MNDATTRARSYLLAICKTEQTEAYIFAHCPVHNRDFVSDVIDNMLDAGELKPSMIDGTPTGHGFLPTLVVC